MVLPQAVNAMPTEANRAARANALTIVLLCALTARVDLAGADFTDTDLASNDFVKAEPYRIDRLNPNLLIIRF